MEASELFGQRRVVQWDANEFQDHISTAMEKITTDAKFGSPSATLVMRVVSSYKLLTRDCYVEGLQSLYKSVVHILSLPQQDTTTSKNEEEDCERLCGVEGEAGCFELVGAGKMFEEGIGYKKAATKALVLYEEAARRGCASGMCCMGTIIQSERDNLPEHLKDKESYFTVRIFEKAAELGNAAALHNMARRFKGGLDGVERNETKAIELWMKGGEKGNALSTLSLASLLQSSDENRNMAKVVELYQKLAEMNHPQGLHKLSQLYSQGTGVPKNEVKANELAINAALNGSALASGDLARSALQRGDKRASAEWLYRSACQGNMVGMSQLGTAYQRGDRCLPEDKAKGKQWTKRQYWY